MELKSDAIETLIKSVLTDISQKGYSSVQPFSIGKYKKLATRDQLYASEGNQAARSNCSSSLHCCSHATVPHIVALLGFSFHAANISTFSDNSKSFR